MTLEPSVQVERDGPLAIVRLCRPEKRNALNRSLKQALRNLFLEFRQNETLGGVILTGEGEKAFSAGADLQEMDGRSPEAADASVRLGREMIEAVESLEVPVVAAVRGWVLGAGCELALSCKLIFASEDARLGLPEIKLGFVPAYGGTRLLADRIGRARALMMILSGEPVPAVEALRLGLVDRVVPGGSLERETTDFLKNVCRHPAAARAACRALGSRGNGEVSGDPGCYDSTEAREGIRAFLNRRTSDLSEKFGDG